MWVVRVTVGDERWVLEKKVLKSLVELSQKIGLEIVKGKIPSDQSKACIGLDRLVRILNGGKAKVQDFEFTPEEWEDDFPTLELNHTNSRERAKAIKRYVRSMFLQGHMVTASMISGLYPGLSVHTLRKHINRVCEEIDASESGLKIERMNNGYVPTRKMIGEIDESNL